LYINKTKSGVKQELGKTFGKEKNMTADITETDSTIFMKIRGANTIEADHIYSFDKSGKCSSEKTITWCDTCHEKLLQPLLADIKYKWKKINMNQYISVFEAGVFVEIQMIDNTWSFTIFRMDLSRKMYDFLLETNN
jgi:hypothetical protein